MGSNLRRNARKIENGSRSLAKDAIGRIIDTISDDYEKLTGHSLTARFKKFLAAFIWAWADFVDDAAQNKGKITAKDVGLHALNCAMIAVGLVEGEYTDCGIALTSAVITLFNNKELISNSFRLSLATAKNPYISAAFATISLGAAIVVAYDFINAVQKCEPLIQNLMGENGNYPVTMDWFQLEYRHRMLLLN